MVSSETRDKLTQISLRRNIIFPSADIYAPMGGFYDLGPIGKAIKERLVNAWRQLFIYRHGFFEVETSLVLPEKVLKASGHLDHFSDPITTCKYCGSKFRADHLLDENDIETKGTTIDDINALLKKETVKCLNCGKNGFTDVAFFNLMFKTNIGPAEGVPGYLRPETAQGIFLAFSRMFKSYGKLPMVVGQTGRSFRNEISPRQGVIRLREFSQMEVEYFFDPADKTSPWFNEVADRKISVITQESQEKAKAKGDPKDAKPTVMTCREAVDNGIAPNEIIAYFLGLTSELYEICGIPFEKFRFRHLMPDEMPHYSGGNFDPEIETSFGWVETAGIAYRTDYDLKSHAEMSGKDLSVTLPDGRRIIPHVVEPSLGVERFLWAVLEHAYRSKDTEHEWEWLDLPPTLAPYNVAMFPLMKKDGLAEKAQEITSALRGQSLTVLYDESGSIGKRYARADEAGVKWCVTVDYDSLKDGTVTLRDRNTTKQERINISDIVSRIR